MKNFFWIFFLFFGIYTMNAFPNIHISKKETHLKIKKKKGDYGVIDEKNKKIIIPFIYDKILPVNEDGFAAKKENRWVIYNTQGELISSTYSFEKIHIPSQIDGNNKIVVIGKEKKKRSDVVVIIQNEDRYYYNLYNNILAISSNYFHITKDSKCGTLSINGKEIIAPIYKNISYLRPSKKGEPYMAKVQNEYSGFINLSSGEVVVPVKWKNVEILSPTLFKVYNNFKWGIVDNQNREIVPIQYNYITALSPKLIKVENNNETFFVSIDQNDTSDSNRFVSRDSLQIDQKNMKFGVIDRNKNIIIPFEYTNIINTPQQVFIVNKNKKYKLIDFFGKEVTSYYKHIEYNNLTQNFLIENKKGKWCVMNYTGEILLETKLSNKEKLIDFLNEKTQPEYHKEKAKRNRSGWLEGVGNVAAGIGMALLYVVYAVVYVIVALVDLTYI